MLTIIDDVLNPDELSHCLATLAKAQWQAGKLSAGGSAQQVKENLQLNDSSDIAVQLRSLIMSKLRAHPQFISACLPKKIFPPKINCYRDGGHYGLHVDNAMLNMPSGEYLRSDISATLFLCAPEDYDGGELLIEGSAGAQSIKLAAGAMVLYPSTSLHQVLAVTRGQRICSFFWLESLVKSAFHREQLFDLDQCIQSLSIERGANDEQVRKLTGVYHNLLRAWGQT